LREGLTSLRYEEGKNLDLDWRNLPDEEAARVAALEFVRNRVDLIVAFENQTIRAARAATSEIPIVMLHGADPVVYGWVESFAHPGGNVTGFVGQPDLPDKRLEFFKAVAPDLRTLLVLIDLEDPTNRTTLPVVHRTAALLNVDLLEEAATSEDDLERVFGALRPGDADGIFIASQNLLVKHQGLILKLGLEKRMPLMSQRKEWVEQGALVSYGPDLAATGQAAASRYVDKILKGTKPGDLPVEQADHLELAVNVRTAKALGIEIPRSLLAQADVIVQ
jgi:putative ABC transport system substrate-binding protein